MKSKTIFLTLSVSISALSVLTGVQILPGPKIAGVILAFFSIFIIPGAYITLFYSGCLTMTVEGVCRVFFTGVIFAAIVVSLGFIPGVGYALISVTSGTINVASAFFYHLYLHGKRIEENKPLPIRFKMEGELSVKEKRTILSIIIVVFAICFVFFESSGELDLSSDALDHVSFIRRSIDSDTILPLDSFYKEGDGTGADPRKGLWHPILSLWAFQSDSAPDFLWSMVPSFFAFLALISFWFYTKELLGTVRLTFFASLLFLIFMRGGGIAWLTKIGYSKNISLLLLWGTAGYIIRYVKTRSLRDIILASLLVVTGTAFHIAFGYLFFSIAASFFIFAVFIARGRSWIRELRSIVPVLTVIAAAAVIIRLLLFPEAYNMIHTHRQGLLLMGDRFLTVDPVEILDNMGLVFFFIIAASPLVFLCPRRKGAPILTGILFLFPVLIVLNPLTATPAEAKAGYLFYRLLFAAPAISMLALILSCCGKGLVFGRFSEKKRSGAGGVVAVRGLSLLLISVFILIPLRFAFSRAVTETENILTRDPDESVDAGIVLESLTGFLPEGSVVMTDPVTSYLLSAYTDHFVVVTLGQHGSPSDPEGLKRIQAVRDMFDPSIPLWSDIEWLKKKNVEYLIIDRYQSGNADFFRTVPRENIPGLIGLMESCAPALVKIGEEKGYLLIMLDIEALEKLKISDPAMGRGRADNCALRENRMDLSGNEYAWDQIRIESVHFDKAFVMPGDTLSGYFCWSLSDTVEFGLPLEWTMRIDAEFPKGSFFRPWYDKQYRRIVERRKGLFYRYTMTGRLGTGTLPPDRWEAGVRVREDFSFVIPRELASGEFEVRLSVRRASYLPNRRLSDYLRNQDSFSGPTVGQIHIWQRMSKDGSLPDKRTDRQELPR